MKSLFPLFLLCLFTLSLHSQTTVNIPASQDNTIFEDSGTLSNGAGDYLFAGRTFQPFNRRALIKFDLSGIPAGAIISNVTLNITGSKGGANLVDVHQVVADWGEGGSNAPGQEGMGTAAQVGDATWANTFFNTGIWTNPGGDFVPTPSASATVSNGMLTSWNSPQLIMDVNNWVSGANPNFGWILIGEEGTNGSAVRMNSKENSFNPPFLTVTYNFTSTCMTNITVSGVIPSGLYEATNDVNITGTTVPGSISVFKGGGSVTMSPGSEITLGTEADLIIGPCI